MSIVTIGAICIGTYILTKIMRYENYEYIISFFNNASISEYDRTKLSDCIQKIKIVEQYIKDLYITNTNIETRCINTNTSIGTNTINIIIQQINEIIDILQQIITKIRNKVIYHNNQYIKTSSLDIKQDVEMMDFHTKRLNDLFLILVNIK